jgi:aspartyl-tRNA(Asn)/glutamyl-tRNA(Gln) amidotransferase subunit C
MDREIIKNIANLARIRVPDDNLDHLTKELSSIMDWVEQLDSVNTDGVEPLASVIDVTLPLREDKITDGDCRNKILANGPEVEDGYFAVPKVIE